MSSSQIAKTKKVLSYLVKQASGFVQINELLEIILAIAVVSKVNPKGFESLYKEPKSNQKDHLLNQVNTNKQLIAMQSLSCLERDYLNADILQEIIYAIYECENKADLAKQILATIEQTGRFDTGKFLSVTSLAKLLKQLVGGIDTKKVFDGAAGICNITSLLNCKELVLEDISKTTRDFGLNILTLKGINADYKNNDSLLNAEKSHNADIVVTQPPFALRLSTAQQQLFSKSKFLSFDHGKKIPASANDALWIQHALFHLNSTGKAYILMTQGWLFRGGYDAKLRNYLLDNDLIETLIGLPAGLIMNTSIATMIVILNKNKANEKRGGIDFLDASKMGEKQGRYKQLTETDITLISKLIKGEEAQHESYKSILLPDIHKNNNILDIRRYITYEEKLEMPNVEDEIHKLNEAQKHYDKANNKLMKLLKEKK